MKNIYEISEFYNPKGFGYCFNATDKCKYTLLFNRLGENKYIFEFDKSKKLAKKLINFQLVRDSICKVIQNFIEDVPERVLFIIYENENNLDISRFRLFNNWFEKYNKSKKFMKIDFATSKNEIVTTIFASNNIQFINEIGLKD